MARAMRNLPRITERKTVSHICKTSSLGLCLWFSAACQLFSQGFTTSDLYRLRAVNEVSLARDGSHMAYTVMNYDRPERPYSQVWVMDLATRKTTPVGGEKEIFSAPLWSPDSRQMAYLGATPGSHTAEFAGDPLIIKRYLYRPTMTEGFTRFTDNRHLHIFVADLATRQVLQLTYSDTDEHSIDYVGIGVSSDSTTAIGQPPRFVASGG